MTVQGPGTGEVLSVILPGGRDHVSPMAMLQGLDVASVRRPEGAQVKDGGALDAGGTGREEDVMEQDSSVQDDGRQAVGGGNGAATAVDWPARGQHVRVEDSTGSLGEGHGEAGGQSMFADVTNNEDNLKEAMKRLMDSDLAKHWKILHGAKLALMCTCMLQCVRMRVYIV
jgi:hypothetical protein